MSLTGLAGDPTPGTRREILFGQGDSLGTGSPRVILLYGNKTSAGSDTLDALPATPIQSDQDARDRLGARSELYQDYRTCAMALGGAAIDVYCLPVTEASGGTPGTVLFTFGAAITDAATAGTTADVVWGGFSTTFSVSTGDTAAAMAAAFVTAINNAENATWPFTALARAGGNAYKVDVNAANVGDRGALSLTPLRVTFRKAMGVAVVKGVVGNGTATDDFTTAYNAAVAGGAFYYQASPKHASTSVSATDNGIGELCSTIQDQALPVNGKCQICIHGLIGTGSEAIAVATSSITNTARSRFFWAEASDWTPGMIAAHMAGVLAVGHASHPAYNFSGHAQGKGGIALSLPPPHDRNDIPTATEIRAALNNGVCPFTFTRLGAASLVREVTSYSYLPGTTTNDYRQREGHITSAIDFFWDAAVAPAYEAQKQPFTAADPPQGAAPLPSVTYPRSVKALIASAIDDCAGPNPQGVYRGPILDPSSVAQMKARIIATKITGGISVIADVLAVEHNNKAEFTIREVSPAQ